MWLPVAEAGGLVLILMPRVWLPAALVGALVLVMVIASAALWQRWLNGFPIYALELLALGLVIFGVVGHDYGLDGLFWHEDLGVQLTAGISVGTLALLLFSLSFVLDDGSRLGEVAAQIWGAPQGELRRLLRRTTGAIGTRPTKRTAYASI